jgi:hypothetical protein
VSRRKRRERSIRHALVGSPIVSAKLGNGGVTRWLVDLERSSFLHALLASDVAFEHHGALVRQYDALASIEVTPERLPGRAARYRRRG